MKSRTLTAALVVAFFVFSACQNPTSVSSDLGSPELTSNGTPSLAKAKSTPVQGTITVTGVIDPGEEFETPGGTLHIRGQVLGVSLTGDLTGTGTFTLNTNGNAKKGNGGVSGPFLVEVDWMGTTGTFSGQLAGHLDGFILSATFVGHGRGDLAGLKWQARAEGPINGPFTYDGRIHDPHGG